jgi:hypothetical protein
MHETRLRAGLAAAADRVMPPSDLFERVAIARSRATRNHTLLIVASGSLMTLLVTVGIAVAVRPSVGPSDRITASAPRSGAACPSTDNDQPTFNTRRESPMVDPATTEVRVCHYSRHPGPFVLDETVVLTGSRAAALVRQLNSAPSANTDTYQPCIPNREQEMWIFATGADVTAEVQVQLGGCGFAYDGRRTITWQHGSARDVTAPK